jgi:4-amino-4-deoxychorismate lyase
MSHSGNDLLFESIQIRDGVPQRLDLHQARMDRTRKYHFGVRNAIELASVIDVPENLQQGLVKCRLTYGEGLGKVEFEQYRMRPFEGISIVEDDNIHYAFKYNDRSQFKAMEDANPGRAVIIAQHGHLTDATYANIAFHDGKRWVTPVRTLLNGTMRQWLLGKAIIDEVEVSLHELPKYESLKLINAMLEWDESPIIPLHGHSLP